MKKIVLFGAGRRAPYYIERAVFFGLKIDCIVDNNKQLTGKKLKGIYIDSPLCLTQDCAVIITCKDEGPIHEQLKEMGLEQQIYKEEEFWKLTCEMLEEQGQFDSINFHRNKTVVFDLVNIDHYFSKWGGTENWSYAMAGMLQAHKRKVLLFMHGKNRDSAINDLPAVLFESSSYTIIDIVQRLADCLPCVIINNISRDILYAALIVLKIYPGQLRILSMLHIDVSETYRNSVMYDEFVSRYMCVSLKIRNTLIHTYGIPESKVCFKESMIRYDEIFEKHYHTELEQPLTIGYACRLVKHQKRTHLLPSVISRLERYSLNYILEIAGDGECYGELQAFIEENGLEKRVRLLGRLNRGEMEEYWKRQDIYLNISSFEGTSLAMLEAMSYGCIPVVTAVSGVDEFVAYHRNGCVVEVDNPQKAAEEIAFLAVNRGLLKPYGDACRKAVKQKCNPDEYLEYMEKIIFPKE